jgi:hypothetical protein
MNIRARAVLVAAVSSVAIGALAAPAANASLFSILPGSCGTQAETQPFSKWGDTANYFLLPGGTFEQGSVSWALSGGAAATAGNETYYVHSGGDARSLTLPSGSSATSPAVCTSIYDPTLRLFVRNTGSTSSRLKVEALYPGLLGAVRTAKIGDLSGSSSWQATPTLQLLLTNLLATLSVDQTAVAYRFTPEDSTGKWSIDDVYVDPRMR